MQHTATRGATTHTSTYGYDAAGRLITANIPGHELTYGFGVAPGCGNVNAGKSGNRTLLVDTYTAPGAAVVESSTSACYDHADRLLSSSVTNPVVGANSVTGGLASADIVYDARGNTVKLADMTFAYDAANRHVGTTYANGSTVSYMRDVAGRIIQSTTNPVSGSAVTTTYLYAGGADAAWGQVTGSTLTRTVSLPGGVSTTITTGTSPTWSFPNLQGHTLLTRTGTTTSAGLMMWDPFGQPLDPVTLAIGTTTADDTGTLTGNTGWHQAALKQAATSGSTTVIEMGARLYVPALGRFLQIDPIEGAGENDYNWPNDPISLEDLDGRMPRYRPDIGGTGGNGRPSARMSQPSAGYANAGWISRTLSGAPNLRAGASSRVLGENLMKSGIARPMQSAAHHLVAGRAKAAQAARNVLQRFNININDPANGAFLPRNLASSNPDGVAVHSTLHTSAYYSSVNKALERATSRADALAILADIRASLMGGGYP